MSYTYDEMSPREFREAWNADAPARECRRSAFAAADREAKRILAMTEAEVSALAAREGVTDAGATDMAKEAFRRAEQAVEGRRRGLCLVLVGPSGSGKTTIMKQLLMLESRLHPSVSVTTRQPRSGEFHDVDYHFTSRQAFNELLETGGLLEHTEYAGNFYGTRRHQTEVLLRAGIDLVFVLDYDGCVALQAALPGDVVAVFIQPPSTGVLWDRLLARGETPESIERRWAVDSALWTTGQWVCEHSVVNDGIGDAVRRVLGILQVAREVRVSMAEDYFE